MKMHGINLLKGKCIRRGVKIKVRRIFLQDRWHINVFSVIKNRKSNRIKSQVNNPVTCLSGFSLKINIKFIRFFFLF